MQQARMKRIVSPAGAERMQVTQFKAGCPGRRHGSRNVMNNSLRECVVEAADRLGSDGKGRDGVVGFLMSVGRRHPTHLLALLGKALPIEVRTPDAEDERHYRTPEEIRQKLWERGIGPEMLRLMADRMATPDRDAALPQPTDGGAD